MLPRSYGIGTVQLQQQPNGTEKPVAHQLTPTQQLYAQIEKEALAFTWACERLESYLLRMIFHLLTDHRPLFPLLSKKNLDELPI